MNKHQSDAELTSYFREARSWADDRSEQNARSRRIAWIVAGVATTIAALFRFRDRPLAETDRFINPLGFEVLRYRKDPEAVSASTEALPAGTGYAPPQMNASTPTSVPASEARR